MVLEEIKIIGCSMAIKRKQEFINKSAKSDKNVLIWGETGTGKDITAKKLHQLSDRRNKPFVVINCVNIPEGLFESELFGYVRGAFTGATKEKIGLFEIAKDGTIFLDEIGDLSLHLQAKILRIIEEKKLRRIGDTTLRKIYSRFIFATNKNLFEEAKNGRFRKDLFFRINVLRLYIPPLKERKEDIPLLVNHILERENNGKRPKKGISKHTLDKLMSYDYPGNIRELENIIERACVISESNILREKDIVFDFGFEPTSEKNLNITPYQLRKTLEKCRWNKTRAATEIGKSRRQFYRLLDKYQMRDCIRRN